MPVLETCSSDKKKIFDRTHISTRVSPEMPIRATRRLLLQFFVAFRACGVGQELSLLRPANADWRKTSEEQMDYSR
ncbi:MAG: hypothetical protein L3K26_09860, partial [Candidatus Hydrogenedentes bacterium]|nr:hypothetical protein [Candidatus Hydrogenedentota bacterium]